MPEYNYGMENATKNAIDYLKNGWNGVEDRATIQHFEHEATAHAYQPLPFRQNILLLMPLALSAVLLTPSVPLEHDFETIRMAVSDSGEMTNNMMKSPSFILSNASTTR
ncbi:hypothetical protein TRIATDRAFT_87473 [Trichoderma atroviride IMI 206040]|uniref:Uncharacterized protein n=1 Tax=Hypocrea atroviridis (strain ATCC 20476 / IMI 206040) TaxID=452589 RepID=G9NYA8_HYPAI|nr:uncharacterized protein TRIATDRAFT_87473 [Trichoderma atroviride IMI 206040]EHK44433.1 hypothetical protein TRIATDRAFT_87473 [Trichoderma atroviride IMI 206040]